MFLPSVCSSFPVLFCSSFLICLLLLSTSSRLLIVFSCPDVLHLCWKPPLPLYLLCVLHLVFTIFSQCTFISAYFKVLPFYSCFWTFNFCCCSFWICLPLLDCYLDLVLTSKWTVSCPPPPSWLLNTALKLLCLQQSASDPHFTSAVFCKSWKKKKANVSEWRGVISATQFYTSLGYFQPWEQRGHA